MRSSTPFCFLSIAVGLLGGACGRDSAIDPVPLQPKTRSVRVPAGTSVSLILICPLVAGVDQVDRRVPLMLPVDLSIEGRTVARAGTVMYSAIKRSSNMGSSTLKQPVLEIELGSLPAIDGSSLELSASSRDPQKFSFPMFPKGKGSKVAEDSTRLVGRLTTISEFFRLADPVKFATTMQQLNDHTVKTDDVSLARARAILDAARVGNVSSTVLEGAGAAGLNTILSLAAAAHDASDKLKRMSKLSSASVSVGTVLTAYLFKDATISVSTP